MDNLEKSNKGEDSKKKEDRAVLSRRALLGGGAALLGVGAMGIIGDREEAKRNEFQATLDAAERRDYEKRVSENNEKMRSLQETIKNLTTNWNVKIAYKVNLIQTTPALLLDVEVIAPGIEKPYKLRQLSEIIVVPVNNSADQIEVTLMETSKKPDSNEYDFVGHRFWLRKDESGKVTSL